MTVFKKIMEGAEEITDFFDIETPLTTPAYIPRWPHVFMYNVTEEMRS